jgi:carboxypeptidase C (cathepsin A)
MRECSPGCGVDARHGLVEIEETEMPSSGNTRTFVAAVILAAATGFVLLSPSAGQEGSESLLPTKEKSSTTRHMITLAGEEIPYLATAGNYLFRAEDGTPRASVFFTSYVKEEAEDPSRRPVTFSFNGGPGSAAVWVQFGAFGPKRVLMDDEGMPLPPPGRLVDNDDSILDLTDLVFIDPVGTGFSRVLPGGQGSDYHGLEEDIESVGEFIRLWMVRNGRLRSPMFIAGESYGTTRAAGLADFLADRYGIFPNGIVFISSILNWQNQLFAPGNDIPHIIHLPTYAATAWYHGKLSEELSRDLEETLEEVEAFALGDFALALLQGDDLSPQRHSEIAGRVARYTGLSTEFVEANNLRVGLGRFRKELLRSEGKTVGRLDSRFTGSDRDSGGDSPEYDASSVAVDIGYVALLNDYVRQVLGYETDMIYESSSSRVRPWNWGRGNRYADVAETLRQAMVKNPTMKVLFTCGYYDFATPYFDTEFTVAHLALPEELRDNVEIAYYEAGHMMYIRRVDHDKFRRDIAEFIQGALQQ